MATASHLADAKLGFVHQQVFGLVDGQIMVGADHPIRAARGEEGVIVPMQKVKNYTSGTLMFYQLLGDGHLHAELAGQFHAAALTPSHKTAFL